MSWLFLLKLWIILNHYLVFFFSKSTTARLESWLSFANIQNQPTSDILVINSKKWKVLTFILLSHRKIVSNEWRRKYIFPSFLVQKSSFHFWEHIEATENLVVWSLIYKYGFANWIPSSACRLRVNMDSKSANNVRKLPSLRLAMTIEMQNQYIDNMLISMFFLQFQQKTM